MGQSSLMVLEAVKTSHKLVSLVSAREQSIIILGQRYGIRRATHMDVCRVVNIGRVSV